MEEKRCFTEQVNSKLHHFKLFNISSPLKAFKKCALYYMRGFFFFWETTVKHLHAHDCVWWESWSCSLTEEMFFQSSQLIWHSLSNVATNPFFSWHDFAAEQTSWCWLIDSFWIKRPSYPLQPSFLGRWVGPINFFANNEP